MALPVPSPPSERKRVKVYELRNNDWFDRGTGFCMAHIVNDEPRLFVESEDQPERLLLETRVSRDDGYQKQQDTLIVWTEQNGTDMALSFQEAEGCAAIWNFVGHIQHHLASLAAPDEALSDDAVENIPNPVMLVPAELRNLAEIEHMMRAASATQPGRESLAKFIINEKYITKLLPLISIAEDLESLSDLHRLCNIMKTLILLNDTAIIEHVVTDEIVLGVVGALEYDPDFPSHKANHRHYLSDESKYKEVVRIEDPNVRKKIHHTYRLQYLKDVVLARILDDPTFSVLNSLIFFNQVDIVQHLQGNAAFLKELFGLFSPQETDQTRKKNAVHFIQQCCAIAKNLQAPARSQLYSNFISNGLFQVINYALRHHDAAVRIAGTDVLVAMIDHDPTMMRSLILKQMTEKSILLTDTLIELLLVEVDLGVKAQIADAIKVLLDPQSSNAAQMEGLGKASSDFLSSRGPSARGNNPQTEFFVQNFYDDSAKKLFRPLKELQSRPSMRNLTIQEVSLFSHLVEILCFFVRQHLFRSKYFILGEGLASRIAQLLSCPEKHLKLTALKFFRTCIGLQDEFYNRRIMQDHLFGPVLDIVYETMPRDNLLNSACLELFEFIKRENIKPLIMHIVTNHGEKIKQITYVDTFQNLVLRYDQMADYKLGAESAFLSPEEDSARTANGRGAHHQVNGNQRWQGVKEMDPTEEEYFNTSDDEDDTATANAMHHEPIKSSPNGISSGGVKNKSLVDYPDEDDDDDALPDADIDVSDPTTPPSHEDHPSSSTHPLHHHPASATSSQHPPSSPPRRPAEALPTPPPERLSEKRRREEDEDEDDELGKLAQQSVKRRSSSVSSVGSAMGHTALTSAGGGGVGGGGGTTSQVLRRKKSFVHHTSGTNHHGSGEKADKGKSDTVHGEHPPGGAGGKRIAISLAVKSGAAAGLHRGGNAAPGKPSIRGGSGSGRAGGGGEPDDGGGVIEAERAGSTESGDGETPTPPAEPQLGDESRTEARATEQGS
ncbi:MAG: Platinum sensitivity protein [Caeruleum heppii]|nr:MAG: Platinum sensitivity protein [Caeruleum heppii]